MKSSWCQVTASARVYLETMLLTLKCSLAVVATIHGYKNCFASFFGLKISRHFHRTKKRTSCKSKRFCFFRVTGVTKRCLIEYTINTTNGVTVQCLSRNPLFWIRSQASVITQWLSLNNAGKWRNWLQCKHFCLWMKPWKCDPNYLNMIMNACIRTISTWSAKGNPDYKKIQQAVHTFTSSIGVSKRKSIFLHSLAILSKLSKTWKTWLWARRS